MLLCIYMKKQPIHFGLPWNPQAQDSFPCPENLSVAVHEYANSTWSTDSALRERPSPLGNMLMSEVKGVRVGLNLCSKLCHGQMCYLHIHVLLHYPHEGEDSEKAKIYSSLRCSCVMKKTISSLQHLDCPLTLCPWKSEVHLLWQPLPIPL